MSSILKNNTWVLSNFPPGSKLVCYKKNSKSRLKFMGQVINSNPGWLKCLKKPDIDYFDTYTRMVRISTTRLLISLAAIHDLVVHQLYV